MIFSDLQPLLQSTDLTLKLSASGDNITVVVVPKVKDIGSALATPLSLTATAAELDAGFTNIVAQYAGSRSSLAEQLEASKLVMEAAGKTAVENASKKAAENVSKSKPPVSPVSKGGEGEGADITADGANPPAAASGLGDLF